MFSNHSPLTVAPLTEANRSLLLSMIHFERHVHRHLDWRSPVDWIGQQPFLAAHLNGKFVAALACPPDPPNVSWIRLFIVSNGISPERAWQSLWFSAKNTLTEFSSMKVAAMPFTPWFCRLLETSGFLKVEQVVVLAWKNNNSLPVDNHTRVQIRSLIFDDYEQVMQIDKKAFAPLWQNSPATLKTAYEQSVLATVALASSTVVGYQISTATTQGGHLARLAVAPSYQGNGIGQALVHDVIQRFITRGAKSITVNTQVQNLASLAVYNKTGFQRTGETYPVYQYVLN